MIATLSQDIARPPAIVYAILVDQGTWAALDPALLEITPRGSVMVGMSGTMRRRVAAAGLVEALASSSAGYGRGERHCPATNDLPITMRLAESPEPGEWLRSA